jgi:hypothetical protein
MVPLALNTPPPAPPLQPHDAIVDYSKVIVHNENDAVG